MRIALIVLALISAGVALQVIVLACLNAVDQGRPVRWSAAALSRLCREWGVHMVTGAALPLGAIDPGPRETPLADRSRPPVILIPGYGMNRACFFFAAAWLRRRGFPWVWAVNNRPHSAEIPLYAARLAEAVQRLKRASGAERVDLVGHSAGGVIAAWYLKNLGGAAHVRRLVTIGTPWQGTRLAIFGQRVHARDLLPGSPVIRAIQGPPVPSTSLWTRTDGMLFPFTSAQTEGVNAVEIEDDGHLAMLFTANALGRLRDALLAPEEPVLGSTPTETA